MTANVLTAPMEGEEDSEESTGTSSEEQSMSPLHQEEEVLPIMSREEFDLMTRVLDDQPILGNAVSGQRCIRSAGSLPLSKYHPYVRSSYFKGQLRGLPSTEAFRSRYISERFEPATSSVARMDERETMSAQELRTFILQSSQRGMLIRQALGAMQQVMDQVQIQQLSLLLQSSCMEMVEESDGVGTSEGETLAEEMAESILAEDRGEVHDFEGNND